MKKLVLVLAILSLGSMASATSFGFLNYLGTILYCNYEVFSPAPAFGASAIQVQDNLQVGCLLTGNATGGGVTGGAKLIDVSDGTGDKVTLKGIVYGDNLYDAFSSYAAGAPVFTGSQWTVVSNVKCGDTKKHFGWYGIASNGGAIFGDNFGHLDCTIPGKGKVASHGTNAGKFTK